jgi:hypothetical protein
MIMRRIIAGIRIKENKNRVIELKKKMIIPRLAKIMPAYAGCRMW